MMRQEDTEGIDLPNGALADLINGRCRDTFCEGRESSQLYTPADWGVTLDGSETINTSFQSGLCFAAAGQTKAADTAPSTGEIFMTYGESDFTGGELATAKGDTPRKWDIWYVVDATSGSESVRYLGNLRLPPVPGYGDTTSTEITAWKTGTAITVTAGPDMTADHEGYYFAWYDGTRDLIDDVGSTTALTSRASGTKGDADNPVAKGVIQPPVNGSLPHYGIEALVMHLGRRIYVSERLPLTGWVEVVGIVDQRIGNVRSEIFAYNDDAILVCGTGVYMLKLSGLTPYYYKMNTSIPSVKITEQAKTGERTYHHRYTYTGVRIETENVRLDRNDADDGALLHKETGPVKADENSVDYGDRYIEDRIGDGSTTYGKLTGAELSSPYDSVDGWNGIDDFEVGLVINSTTYNISGDLTSAMNLSDVAYYIQMAARVREELAEVEVVVEDGVFVLKTGEGDEVSYAVAGAGGTDIATHLGWTSAAGATVEDALWGTPHSLGDLVLPADGIDLTHYGVYRDDVLDEDGDVPAYTWVADIPVAKCITASVDASGNLTITQGELETEDEGCTLVGQDGTRLQVSSATTGSETVTEENGSSYISGAIGSQSWGIGGGTVFTASQSGTAISIASGLSLASDSHELHLIFWADGGYSVVKSVTDASTGVAMTSATHASQAAMILPTRRKFNDTVSHTDIVKGRNAAWPLQNRFYEPMADGNAAHLTDGYLIVGVRGGSKYVYCQSSEAFRIGHHHPALQMDKSTIKDGIQSIRPTSGGVIIRGAVHTYKLSTENPIDVGNPDVGESAFALSTPRIVGEGIGSIGDGGVDSMGNDREILVTAEPAVRVWGGTEYEDVNLAERRIQVSDLQKLKPSYIGVFMRNHGYTLWGVEEIPEASE
jgi:hypothetical protein